MKKELAEIKKDMESKVVVVEAIHDEVGSEKS